MNEIEEKLERLHILIDSDVSMSCFSDMDSYREYVESTPSQIKALKKEILDSIIPKSALKCFEPIEHLRVLLNANGIKNLKTIKYPSHIKTLSGNNWCVNDGEYPNIELNNQIMNIEEALKAILEIEG